MSFLYIAQCILEACNNDYYHIIIIAYWVLKTLRSRQNCPCFAEDIFKFLVLYENCCTLIWISLKFVPNGPIDNTSVLVETMAWCWTGDNPFSEMMITQFTDAYKLTHWGRVTHICIGNLTNIGSDNGLSPDRRLAIIWTNARMMLIGPLETNLSEILIKVHTFSLKKMHSKMSSGK